MGCYRGARERHRPARWCFLLVAFRRRRGAWRCRQRVERNLIVRDKYAVAKEHHAATASDGRDPLLHPRTFGILKWRSREIVEANPKDASWRHDLLLPRGCSRIAGCKHDDHDNHDDQRTDHAQTCMQRAFDQSISEEVHARVIPTSRNLPRCSFCQDGGIARNDAKKRPATKARGAFTGPHARRVSPRPRALTSSRTERPCP